MVRWLFLRDRIFLVHIYQLQLILQNNLLLFNKVIDVFGQIELGELVRIVDHVVVFQELLSLHLQSLLLLSTLPRTNLFNFLVQFDSRIHQ